jgi:hypothetical protein
MTEEKKGCSRTLADAVKENLPGTFTKLSTALLVWLFGTLVFLPAARGIDPTRTPLICSLIVLIGFSFFLFSSLGGLKCLLDASSNFLAGKYIKNRQKPMFSLQQSKIGMKCILYVVVTIIVYALYWPLLRALHPSLAGLVFIPVFLWMSWTIFRTISALIARTKQ